MQLRRVRKARRDQHLAPDRMPRIEDRAAKFEIARHRATQLRRRGRHALDDEIVRHLGAGNSDNGEASGEKQNAVFHDCAKP